MNIALYNLAPILFAFILGFNFKRIYSNISMYIIEKISNFCLYSLLILMGITVGFIPDIAEKLGSVGITAISIALASSLSIAIVLKIFYLIDKDTHRSNKVLDNQQEVAFNIMGYIKDPVLLGGLVILGFAFAYYNIAPRIDYDITISSLLYLLIFIIAVKLSFSGLNIRKIFFNKKNLIMTLLTVLASYAGAAIASCFLPLTLNQSLAVSSGFGWYTLSGILFTKMGDPLLGSVGFLCDLFREAIALLLIPTLSRVGNGNIAIAVAGATAMDVTLPIIEKHCGVSYVPVALLSGGIITVIVPFLIPFFYSM
ncbi:lysine exporter LysO family protein [Serratia plymuthica]|uniref:lysine exporter LysO family protein n=1 Tax=Serratia plymuthica TaxID=82996 RepID=UPI001BB04961|nr:lysine exporter LysO family protein [Serratia plymuthica]QUY46444.1 lysine exporter LysO family protein [Serratia plymuthica]